ncbi:MAG TPA: TonB-dependent receptor [Opitutaceae bacterium]|nr:TonB-dependent receptor [Opitutaceae bacterium]
MKYPSRKWILAGAVALAFTAATSMFAQGVTTSAITGLVTDTSGNAVAGADVTVVHVSSQTKSTTVTRSNGEYDLSGLRPGGPYSVTVGGKGFQTSTQTGVNLSLDRAASVNFSLTSAVVTLEPVTVEASGDTTFDQGNMGTTHSFSSVQVQQVPTIRRDVQDLENADSRIGLTINTSTGEFSVSAQGQNSRYNSFLIDGLQANDPFGLNANGFSSLRSPVIFDAIEAFSIDLNPYDVTRTGFTGALIDVVTKSGTNELRGDLYTFYSGKSLRNSDPGVGPSDPNVGKHDPYQSHTYGFTVGGPIIKDKLFFFFAADDVRIVSLPPSPVIFQPAAADLATVLAAAQAMGINPGGFAGLQVSQQKTFMGKIDWNISDSQRATLSYRRTDSSAPNFTNGSSFTDLTSNDYQSNRIADNASLQLNSSWTPDLHTEAAVAAVRYNGTNTPYGPITPEFYVNGVNGINAVTGAALTNGQLAFGTNHSYQLNALTTNDYNGHLYGDFSWGSHTFKVGGDVDKTGTTDVFVQYYTGQWGFASPAAFAAGMPNYLKYEQASPGFTIPQSYAHYSYTDLGLLVQDTWRPANTNFALDLGLRFDDPYIPNKPIFLPAFQAAFGIPNNTTGTGNYNVEPRLGFNYKLPTKEKIQLRGGLGLFQGTNPAVWVANSFDTTGALNTVAVGSSNSSNTNPPIAGPAFSAKSGYVQSLPPPGAPTPSIDVMDPHFVTPTSWKGNLAVDVDLPWYGFVATAEVDDLKVYKALYYQALNLKQNTVTPFAPDGRIYYSGFSGAIHTNFTTSVLDLTNTNKGGSQAYTLAIARPLTNHWSFSAAYTHTHSEEVQPLTSSVASSNFAYRSIINPNDNHAYNSAYGIPNKYVAQATYEFNLFKRKDMGTRISGIFRMQPGHAYSWVFSGDANNDGTSGNDAFYVPSGPSDPKVIWANAAQQTAFFQYVNQTDLYRYMGSIVPPNSSYNPWQKTIDLHLEQNVPLCSHAKLSLFLDCLNFANLFNPRWGVDTGIDFGTGYNGYNRAVASATINAAGQYVYTFNANTLTTPVTFTDLSRWQLQIGAKLQF